jgi:hypothetical protein
VRGDDICKTAQKSDKGLKAETWDKHQHCCVGVHQKDTNDRRCEYSCFLWDDTAGDKLDEKRLFPR